MWPLKSIKELNSKKQKGGRGVSEKRTGQLTPEQERRRWVFEQVAVGVLSVCMASRDHGDTPEYYICELAKDYTNHILAAADEFAKGEK